MCSFDGESMNLKVNLKKSIENCSLLKQIQKTMSAYLDIFEIEMRKKVHASPQSEAILNWKTACRKKMVIYIPQYGHYRPITIYEITKVGFHAMYCMLYK